MTKTNCSWQTYEGTSKVCIAYWHTMDQEGADPFGVGTAKRNWYGETPMETAKIEWRLSLNYFNF